MRRLGQDADEQLDIVPVRWRVIRNLRPKYSCRSCERIVHPQHELGGFSGFLQADAYAGYDPLYAGGQVTEVACWAHFRRKIFDIHQTKPTALTTDILARIGALYAVEEQVRGPAARCAAQSEARADGAAGRGPP